MERDDYYVIQKPGQKTDGLFSKRDPYPLGGSRGTGDQKTILAILMSLYYYRVQVRPNINCTFLASRRRINSNRFFVLTVPMYTSVLLDR